MKNRAAHPHQEFPGVPPPPGLPPGKGCMTMKTRFLLITFLTLLKPRQRSPRFNQFMLLLSSTLQFSKKGGKKIVFRPGIRFPKSRQSLQTLTLFRQKSCISLPCRENLSYGPDSFRLYIYRDSQTTRRRELSN